MASLTVPNPSLSGMLNTIYKNAETGNWKPSLKYSASLNGFADGLREDLKQSAASGIVSYNITPYVAEYEVPGSSGSTYQPTYVNNGGIPIWVVVILALFGVVLAIK